MFGSIVLEIATGLVLIYIVLAVFNSTLIEFIARILKWRSSTLADGIKTLLNDPQGTGLSKTLYEHPMINGLAKRGKPSYIASRTFALALLDSVPAVENGGASAFEQLRAGVNKISDQRTRTVLSKLLDLAGDDVSAAHKNVEIWFNDAMDRVAGWYTRKTHLLSFALAVLVTLTLNADSQMIANNISHNSTLRDALVAAAGNPDISKLASNTDGQSSEEISRSLSSEIHNIQLPLGWSTTDDERDLPSGATSWIGKVLGLFVTAIAVSLGAPFWF